MKTDELKNSGWRFFRAEYFVFLVVLIFAGHVFFFFLIEAFWFSVHEVCSGTKNSDFVGLSAVHFCGHAFFSIPSSPHTSLTGTLSREEKKEPSQRQKFPTCFGETLPCREYGLHRVPRRDFFLILPSTSTVFFQPTGSVFKSCALLYLLSFATFH